MGTPLLKRLQTRGHEISLLNRSDWEAPKLVLPPGLDAVIHLAGESVGNGRWTSKRKTAIRNSRTQGTRKLIDALLAQPEEERPRTFISASAVGFYGNRDDEPLTETSKPGSGFLAELCIDWEAEARRYESVGRVVCLRIGMVLGPEGGALNKLLPLFRIGLGGTQGPGSQWMSWIHRKDLLELIEYLLQNKAIAGPINAVAPTPVTNAQFTRSLGRVLKRPALVPTPAFALRLALGEQACLVLDSQRASSKKIESFGFKFRFPSIDLALTDCLIS